MKKRARDPPSKYVSAAESTEPPLWKSLAKHDVCEAQIDGQWRAVVVQSVIQKVIPLRLPSSLCLPDDIAIPFNRATRHRRFV